MSSKRDLISKSGYPSGIKKEKRRRKIVRVWRVNSRGGPIKKGGGKSNFYIDKEKKKGFDVRQKWCEEARQPLRKSGRGNW